MHELAIVIPAWKPEFLAPALESLAAQTDRRFTVYVGDDAGPPEIAEICGRYRDLPLRYHRFAENLGGRDLTAQWDRTIALSREPWVWLFGDDDELEPGCVARFHAARAELPDDIAVVRFDTDVIGSAGRVLQRNPEHPRHESGAAFLLARLEGRRNSYVVEYVFRRRVWEDAGGFPDYPAAWCADDAAWYTFSGSGGIVTLDGPRVRWRASGLNITDAPLSRQPEKLRAGRRFLDFVRDRVEPADADHPDQCAASPQRWAAARTTWFENQIRYLSPLPPSLLGDVIRDRRRWPVATPTRVLRVAGWTMRALWRRGLRRVEGIFRRNRP